MENPIGEGIKRLRAQHKLTQTALAQRAEIPRATLANMEGENSNPSISAAVKVARALGVTVDDLITQRQSQSVTQVVRKDMPVMLLDGGKFSSTLTSPISTPNLHINDIGMMPGCHTKGVPHPEGSHELFLCHSGTATVEVDGKTYEVNAGDLIYFPGHLPHSYGNKSLTPTRAMAVIFILE